MAEVVHFNDPDKGRKRSRISNKDKKKLRQGDVAELFSLSDTTTSTGSDASSQMKTWDKSDLTATYHEVAVLADTLTQQQSKEKMPSKQWIKHQKRRRKVLSYPEIQQQQREKKEKELQHREEQRFSGGVTNNKKKKEDSKQRRVAKVGGRWKDSIKGLDPPVGKFKNGVLSLSQKDIKRFSKR
ncbi:uncharacterized protein [Dysidea avara]|uniref:uncharacterized protein n=1 Tax=Dysidea avara TaxID=196820 RepID=UPI00332C1211